MSGGVDSAVAAALAAEAGHDVVGVHMALLRDRPQSRLGSRGCCSIEDALDARRAADKIGIPFYVWDLSETFQDTVVEDFLDEYAAGRTPNPCLRCNEHVKFETLLDRALALGFDAVATGHYAKIVRDGANSPAQLHRARNMDKDQSYVLAVMGQDKLDRALFPLGDFVTKDDVRAESARRDLPVSHKPDSYDICFIPDGDTAGFLRERLGEQPGAIVDVDGKELGQHQGAYAFTVGQRKGLHLGRPAADGKPRYVVDVRTDSNVVVVGPETLLTVNQLDTDGLVLYTDPADLLDARDLTVQVRAHGNPVAATVEGMSTDEMRLRLDNAGLRGVAAGQSAVVYRGSRVLAQGTITKATKASVAL
jgi:tRNA-specific 2-thiouridylase